MGALSRTASKCQVCPNKDKCDHKRMELCAYFEDKPMIESNTVNNYQPNLMPAGRETMTINVGGVLTQVYKDDIQKELYKSLYEHLTLNYGA